MEKVHNVPKYQGGILISDFLKESELIALYYDYLNNFLMLTTFAEHYLYPVDSAKYIVNKGRELCDAQSSKEDEDRVEVEQTHNKLREILRSYNNPEWGDCIVDEICFLFGYPTTTDINPEEE